MDDSIDIYWTKRLERCRKALEGNGFEAFVARDALHAQEITLGEIVPKADARIVSWADSMTLPRTGVLQTLLENPRFTGFDVPLVIFSSSFHCSGGSCRNLPRQRW